VDQGERRQSERLTTKANGVLCHTTFPDGKSVTGLIHNCSEGGARISGSVPRSQIDARVELLFLFPTDERVRYRATVRWVDNRQGLFGVRFDSEPIPVRVLNPKSLSQ